LTAPPAELGPKGRLTLGLILVGLGLVLTLDQARVLNLEGLGRFWPLFLIGIGFVKVRQPLEDGQRALGVALLFVGGFLQLMSILSWGRAWPLLFILMGGLLLWQAIDGRPSPAPAPPASPFVSELALLGATKKSLRLPDFRGGYVTAVVGGAELDLRHSRIASSPTVLDVVALWGGIDLKVPSDWTVEARVVPIMGGFEDKTRPLVESPAGPRLLVRGWAVMGGVVIGN
jgi:hypothetical protein